MHDYWVDYIGGVLKCSLFQKTIQYYTIHYIVEFSKGEKLPRGGSVINSGNPSCLRRVRPPSLKVACSVYLTGASRSRLNLYLSRGYKVIYLIIYFNITKSKYYSGSSLMYAKGRQFISICKDV